MTDACLKFFWRLNYEMNCDALTHSNSGLTHWRKWKAVVPFQSKIDLVPCKQTGAADTRVKGMNSAGDIKNKRAYFRDLSLHVFIFTWHIRCVVVRLPSSILNVDIVIIKIFQSHICQRFSFVALERKERYETLFHLMRCFVKRESSLFHFSPHNATAHYFCNLGYAKHLAREVPL